MGGAVTEAGPAPEAAPAVPKPAKPGLVRRRVTFGLMLGAVALSLLCWDFASGRGFGLGLLTAVALPLGAREMLRMLDAIAPAGRVTKEVIAGAAFVMVALQVMAWERTVPPLPVDVDVLVVVGLVLGLWTAALASEPTAERLRSLLASTFCVCYLLGLGAFALRVRYLDRDPLFAVIREGHPNLGTWLVLFAIVAAKGTDIFAFFTGRALGKRKLIPWISPGKTVAGGVGSVVGAILITLGFVCFTDVGRVFTWRTAAPLGILLAIVTMAGDLVESFVKRATAVKDSGALVPEFGGVLDIVDSVLFVLPVVYLTARASAA